MFAYCNNNPVNGYDPNGYVPKDTFLTFEDCARVCLLTLVIFISTPVVQKVIGYFAKGTAKLIENVSETTDTIDDRIENIWGGNSVYLLKDADGNVQYVGRTKNPGARKTAHNANPARRGLTMEVIASKLSLPVSRALEQAGMIYYHTISTMNKVNNQINSIAPSKWEPFKELALGVLDYGWNQMTNEILFWVGS